MNNVYHVGPNGWTHVSHQDTHELFYKYYPNAKYGDADEEALLAQAKQDIAAAGGK